MTMMVTVKMSSLLVLFLLLLLEICRADELLQSISGIVGAENYTYYRLSRTGKLRVELESIYGDADLYISDETNSPKFDNYKQQSSTCGKEVLEVPNDYVRPIGIGVYGHPNFESSKYVISIFLLPKAEEMEYEKFMDTYFNYEAQLDDTPYDSIPKGRTYQQSSSPKTDEFFGDDEDESVGSVLWQLLITILKLVFEVIL